MPDACSALRTVVCTAALLGPLATASADLPDAKLRASDLFERQDFGTSVALKGDVALIGAPEVSAPGNGSAYVFRFDGASWVEEQKLVAPDGSSRAGFGVSVALGDESVAIVGAYQDDEEGIDAGAAYVFRHDGASWVFEEKLVVDVPVGGDLFGIDVAMGPTTAVVGANMDSFDGISDAGSVFVFEFNGTSWAQASHLKAPDAAKDDEFGIRVAYDGTQVAGGAWLNDDDGSGSGSAYVFDTGGVQTVTAFDGAAFDSFGIDVAVQDGLFVVGAFGDDDGGNESGAVYTFRDELSGFAFDQKLVASDPDGGEDFGAAIALDGDVMIIGARVDDDIGVNSGSVYVWYQQGGAWREVLKQHASDADGGDHYGWAVAVDGDRVLVGAPFDDEPINAGSAYVFEIPSAVLAVPALPWTGTLLLALLLGVAGVLGARPGRPHRS